MSDRYAIAFKRVYDDIDEQDGQRILVDRLWPRGIKKEKLQLSTWCKDCCPSHQLRQAYHAHEIDFNTFAERYFSELEANIEALTPLLRASRNGKVTLLSAVKTFEQSHLPVLKHALLCALAQEDREADGDEHNSPVCFGKDFNYWN